MYQAAQLPRKNKRKDEVAVRTGHDVAESFILGGLFEGLSRDDLYQYVCGVHWGVMTESIPLVGSNAARMKARQPVIDEREVVGARAVRVRLPLSQASNETEAARWMRVAGGDGARTCVSERAGKWARELRTAEVISTIIPLRQPRRYGGGVFRQLTQSALPVRRGGSAV